MYSISISRAARVFVCAVCLVWPVARAVGQSSPAGDPSLARLMVRSLEHAYQHGKDGDTARAWRVQLIHDSAMVALLDATMFRLASQDEAAIARYRVAARDTLLRAAPYAIVGLASSTANLGGYDASIALLVRASKLMLQQGDSIGQAEALIGQAVVSLRVFGVDSARTLMRHAMTLIPPHDEWLRARVGCASIQVEVRAGALIADSVWQRLEGSARAQGPVLLSACASSRAQYLESTGHADASLALLDTVAELQRRSRQWANVASTLQWQGSSLLSRGRYGEARERLDSSLAAARRSASTSGDAWATLQLGVLDRRLGAIGDAAERYARARLLMINAGDATGLAYTDRAQAELLHSEGQLAAADSQWRALVERVDRIAPQFAVPGLLARSDIARRTGALSASAALLDSAAAQITARNMPGWRAEWRYFRGLHEMAAGNGKGAVAQWDTLLREQRRLRIPARFEVVTRWAEVQAGQGRFDVAWRTFRNGAQQLDQWRRSQKSRDEELAAIGDRQFDWDRDLGLATTSAAFAQAGHSDQALAMAEWRRLRTAQQIALQRGALVMESTVAGGQVLRVVDSSAIDPARLPTLARARLQPTQAVVAYITGLGGEPTTAFVLTRDTLVSVPLPPIDSLRRSIAAFAAFLQAGARPAALTAALSEQILVPVLRALSPAITRVVLVPDGELHRLPFAALNGVNGQSVLEQYELATATSAEDAFGGAVGVARRPEATSLVIGAPSQMPVNVSTGVPWGDLPGARAEARVVARLLGQAESLAGDAATRDAVMRRVLRGGPVLHVATHAVANPNSLANNGLVLQSSSHDSGFFSLADVRAQPLPFDLVVLSACASGEGLMLAGQSLHGLVSTALDAGARGVIATRWTVNDTAIVPLMVHFYEALQRGDDVVTAVNHMRRDAMHAGISPAVWANIEYVGDPTLRVTLKPAQRWWSRVGRTVGAWLRAVGLK